MPLRGTFRFEKMSGSFKKGETLRFADYKMAAILERRAAISEIYFLSISFKANA